MKKLLLIIPVLALIAPMFITDPDGEPIMTPTDWVPDKPTLIDSASVDNSQTLYRYQDEKGNWHYSDQPPIGVNAEVFELENKATIIEAVKPREKSSSPSSRPSALGIAGYTQKMTNIVKDAENVKVLMDERTKQLEDSL